MESWILTLLILSLATFLFWISGFLFGAPFWSTDKKTLRKMIEFAKVKLGEKVVDLGSGNGKIVIEFAKLPDVKESHGFEINPLLVFSSRRKIKKLNLEEKAFIHWKNFWKQDLSDDIVILTGDLTFMEMPAKNIVGPFIKKKKQVLLIPGNHESNETVNFLTELYPGTKNIHGDSFIKSNLGIFGAGGADIGIHEISDKEISNLLHKSHEKVKGLDKKLMVTHMHPQGTKSEFSGFEGSKSIRKAIEEFQPDIAIFSHIHEASGTEDKIGKTRAINVSRKGKIFEI